jgi:hypothetical protein
MREANDRGFECLLLEDCCGATERGNHLAAIKMIKMQGGVFGSVSNSDELIRSVFGSAPDSSAAASSGDEPPPNACDVSHAS